MIRSKVFVWAVFAGLLVVMPSAVCAAATGGLLVVCWPGYEVLVDGEPMGETVAAEDGRYLPELAAGRHEVEIRRAGFEPWRTTVEVPAGGIAELRVPELAPTTGSLRVDAAPGHRVYLDGRLIGLTSSDGLEIPDLEVGEWTLRVEKLGFEPFETVVAVEPGATGTVVVGELTPLGGDLPPRVKPVAPATPPPGSPAPEPTAGVVERSSEPMPGGEAPSPAAGTESPPPELPAPIRPTRPTPADIGFVYRASGASLNAGGAVTVTRERGGPRAPVMVFWCVGASPCVEHTKATFAPGDYRFRVNCRQGEGEAAVDADVFLDMVAVSGRSYLVDVTFDRECTATVITDAADGTSKPD